MALALLHYPYIYTDPESLKCMRYRFSNFLICCRCSVCLGEYQAEDRLQQIPACGHTFHMDCIDHWLSTRTTCPLCRLSLLPPTKPPSTPQPLEEETSYTPSVAEEDEQESSIQSCSHSTENPPPTQHLPETSNRGGQTNSETGSAAVEIVGV